VPLVEIMAKPSKMAQYLAAGDRLREAVAVYRVAKEEASAAVPTPTPTKKRRSYPLPPADGPTPIPGYEFNPRPPAEVPEYDSMSRVKAIRAAQAAQRGRRAPFLTPSGQPELRKRAAQ
jgi:hypothetical protein